MIINNINRIFPMCHKKPYNLFLVKKLLVTFFFRNKFIMAMIAAIIIPNRKIAVPNKININGSKSTIGPYSIYILTL